MRPKDEYREMISQFSPEEIAFQSGSFVSMLLWYASFGIGWNPQEIKGVIEKNAIRMEWWWEKCPKCGTPYHRLFESGEREILVDKSNPKEPKCSRCGETWGFAKLFLVPKFEGGRVSFGYQIESINPVIAGNIKQAFQVGEKVFNDNYQALIDLRKKSL